MHSNGSKQRLTRILAPTVSAFLLTACAASGPSANAPINLPELPAEVRTCKGPTELPAGFMSQAKVERNWASDRANLVICRNNLNTVVGYYDEMREGLTVPPGQ
ncbi:hypothetical protein GCM10023174_10110 [Chelativorans composti]